MFSRVTSFPILPYNPQKCVYLTEMSYICCKCMQKKDYWHLTENQERTKAGIIT